MFDDQGDPFSYRKLSARIPEFLKDFPPDKGYSVVVEAVDPITLKPGLLRLYEAAINAGKTFEECGLPAFTGQDSLVYQAKLADINGVVLCSRSAVMQVSQYKDHETGETAAVQRLLSALGYDGASLDDDESKDFSKQGITVKPETTAEKPAAAKEPATATKPVTAKPATAKSSKKSETSDNKKDVPVDDEKTQPDDVPDTMVLQIKQLSELKDVEIPVYTNLKEAKQALKTLRAA